MNKLIQLKLDALKEFQNSHPTAHVGGSIGLMLRGIELKRDLSRSDLDITVDEFSLKTDTMNLVESSDSNDFDFALQKNYDNGYVKIDIRISPEPSFDIVQFEEVSYNVSKLRDILFWKNSYANKGVQKHKDDLLTMETGVRPLTPVTEENILLDDDLPF
jgi:hypothetical protein